jgi:hypothetical protein
MGSLLRRALSAVAVVAGTSHLDAQVHATSMQVTAEGLAPQSND